MEACFEGAPPKTLGRQVSLFIVSELNQSTPEDVQMTVEVNHTDGAIGSVDASK